MMETLRVIAQDFLMAIESLKNNKVRTALTMLEITISVAAIIIMMGIMQGQARANEFQFTLGGITNINYTNILGDKGMNTKEMMEFYRRHRDKLDGVAPNYMTMGTSLISSSGKKPDSFLLINLISEDTVKTADWKVRAGSNLCYADIKAPNRVCLIGTALAREIYGQDADLNEIVGEHILLDGRELTIRGVVSAMDENSDDMLTAMLAGYMNSFVAIPYSYGAAYGILNPWDTSLIKVKEAKDVEAVMKAFKKEAVKYAPKEAIILEANLDAVESLQQKLKKQQLTSAALASIALIVAGVGVMNIMLVSVTERTREIGIRKSLGAKRWVIMAQFMFEAAMISTLAGLVGIAIGVAFMKVYCMLNPFAELVGWSVWLAFGVSVGMGLVFGYMPADKASRLKPVDALRG